MLAPLQPIEPLSIVLVAALIHYRYSQTIRIRNNCNDDVTARKRAADLTRDQTWTQSPQSEKIVNRASNLPLQEIVAEEKES